MSDKDVWFQDHSSLALVPPPPLPASFLEAAARHNSLKDTVFKTTVDLKADTTFHTLHIPHIVTDSGEDRVFEKAPLD